MHDRELVQAVKTGNHEAFATLVKRYHRLVYGICYRMTANPSDAEDLAHDAFVEAYLKLHQLREAEKFAPWLKTLTLNLCRMWYRQNKHDIEIDELPLIPFISVTEDESMYERLSYGLSKISATQRLLLILHYWEGLSYEEMAKFLEIPIGTVMSRLHRARHALKQLMEQMVEMEEIPMNPDDDFLQQVDAEIAILLEMFSENSIDTANRSFTGRHTASEVLEEIQAMDRLSVILNRSPERFAKLINQANDEAMLHKLALLLRRLGHPAFKVALDCFFSSEKSLHDKALMLLRAWIAKCKPAEEFCKGFGMPSPEAYLLIDGLIASSVNTQLKAELLLELMEAGHDERTMNLFTEVLLCYADAAFPLLLKRFWASSEPDNLNRSVLYALCRIGARFGEALLETFNTGNINQQTLALAGLEALARSLKCCADKEDLPSAQLALAMRSIGNNAPVSKRHLDSRILQ